MVFAEIPQIGNIVSSARKNMGMTQIELARKIGVTKQTISAVENNHRLPQLDVLYRIGIVLEIPAETILYPRRAAWTPLQHKVIGVVLSCTENELMAVDEVTDSVLRALRRDVSEKQG